MKYRLYVYDGAAHKFVEVSSVEEAIRKSGHPDWDGNGVLEIDGHTYAVVREIV